MPPKFLEESGIARKDFFIILILLFNTFTWWFIMPIIIYDLIDVPAVKDAETLIWTSYYVAIVGSSIVGSILSNKIRRLSFLYLWIALGVVISLLPALLNNFSVMHVLTISILLGASFGLGMPSCLAYFADCTLVENRGRIGGIVMLTTNLSAPLFVLLFGMFDFKINSIILAVWRGFGLVVLFLKPEEKLVSERKKNPSFASILQNKSFALYFIAWLMFCLIDRFETPIQKEFLGEDSYNDLLKLAPLLGGLSAFVGGLLSDRIGRKRVVLYGFVSLGIAYAIIGITRTPLVSWYLSLGVLFISAGMVWVLFILILWGDLSQSGGGERYYAIGTVPFFLTNIVELLSAENVALIEVTSAFSLAAFFLFLAVLPLLYAPETLPQKKIELRRVRKYVEAARKVKEKYEEKGMKG